MTDHSVNERELCLEILMEVNEGNGLIHKVLTQVLDSYAYLEKRQRSFIARVSEGTIEYQLQLDAILNQYSKTKVSKMKPLIRNLLRMSVYQILYMDSVPDSAVCNEAVKLAVKRKFHGLKGFVNGILRTIVREKDNITFQSLSERYSMPQWIIDMWIRSYGQEITEKMLQSFLEKKKLTIRCNTSKCTMDELIHSLEKDNVTVEKVFGIEEALRIQGIDMLYSLESFQKGYFQVQDISSMLVACIADPKPGDTVLDVCGAPGGKALHIADKIAETGMVEVRDLTEQKVALIQENIIRSGLSNIHTSVADATVFDSSWEEKADIVIADLPCSGLGVIGKKPDIKYKTTRQQLKDLQIIQRDILQTVYRYVKKNGTLIYSTCTISREENEENVKWFLEHFPFEPVNLQGCRQLTKISETKEKGYIQLLPGIDDADGFFIAKFRRK